MTEQSMIERVAKAISCTMRPDDDTDPSCAFRYSRAAIEAMREPTEAMVSARFRRLGNGGKVEWEVMIDAALNE